MAKTKEEVQKILENNYLGVQKKEFSVYDKAKEVQKEFTTAVKALSSNLKAEEKLHSKEEKDIKTEYALLLEDIIKANEKLKKDVSTKRKAVEAKAKKANEAAALKQELATKKVNEQIVVIKNENKKLVASTLATYQKDVENTKKAIVSINEKGVKDQNSFNVKISDLRSKHESKVSGLNEKEEIKIKKLTVESNKKVEKLQESIELEREKLDKKITMFNMSYEEELAEIDEKISEDKNSYDGKHEGIRSSADKRIANREKHLQRSIEDNDTRSAKQHKKDIDKFKKEATRDLNILKKLYSQEYKVAIDYRKSFVKEGIAKRAELVKEFSRLREAMQLQIDTALITLKTDIENTKFEYEKIRSEELNNYNSEYADVKEKQLEVLKNQELDVAKKEDNLVKLRYNFEKDNNINAEKLSEKLENMEKELRVIKITKLHDDYLTKDILDNANLNLDNELEVAAIKLVKDKKVNEETEEVAYHNLKHKTTSSNKEEFYNYQQLQEALYTDRAKELFEYEELEANNRYTLKVAFLESERKEVNASNKTLVKKINDVLAKERVPFDKVIEKVAGSKKVELEKYIEEQEVKVNQLKQKIDKLDSKQDKKEKRYLQDTYQKLVSNYKQERTSKEQVIINATIAYDTALKNALRRNEIALEEAEAFNDAENSRINLAIDSLNTNKDNELKDAKNRYNETITSVKDFVDKASTRNQSNTEENLAFLNLNLEHKQNLINLAIDLFEKSKETLNDTLNQSIQKLASEKQSQLDKNDAKLKTEEENLENFKNTINSKIKDIEIKTEKLIQAQNNNVSNQFGQLDQKYIGLIKEIHETLDNQNSEHKMTLQTIVKKTSNEKSHFDSENKRVQKEYEQRLKGDLQKISSKASQDISNLK